ncbi:hypothetical protein jhhlp_008700 [Lomentospora prolificans]|uniref:dolichol kinase n=1 Tax=Lomentospora prolificans TaxID=41688 RepID=A0A2N3MYS0_9PEZI|nr:hypothetical protein jhhlp_008700 [Lomentospora prolificans]
MPKPEHLYPTRQPASNPNPDASEEANLRLLSRSPHPYHRQNFELLQPTDRIEYTGRPRPALAPRSDDLDTSNPRLPKDSPLGSDSGTEADDEHFLKGLPAPRAKPHKGLRGRNEALSGASTPLLSPTIPEHHVEELGGKLPEAIKGDRRLGIDRVRQARHVVRRYIEVALLAGLIMMVLSNRSVQPIRKLWFPECVMALSLSGILLILYPLRLVIWAHTHRSPRHRIPLKAPVQFDPAPLLYPQTITVLTAFLLASDNPNLMLPNIILSLCSIPEQLIPCTFSNETYNSVHWILSCVPLFNAVSRGAPYLSTGEKAWSLTNSHYVTPGIAVLLYPLHQSLRRVLHHLTTTSLLPAELELFSVALINLLLLTSSPQMRILKALLWIGGVSLLVLCGQVITWGIALARVPKWRFKRESLQPAQPRFGRLMRQLLWWKQSLKKGVDNRGHAATGSASLWPWPSSDEGDLDSPTMKYAVPSPFAMNRDVPLDAEEATLLAKTGSEPPNNGSLSTRRNTFPFAPVAARVRRSFPTHTAAGRKKRSTSTSVRAFFSLTQSQATLRKWIYATYVYLCIVGIVLLGIRSYISQYALDGAEAIGWALGYLFGNIDWFRFKVVSENLDKWICLPPRPSLEPGQFCHQGWAQHIRLETFGGANTRLMIIGYWFMILAFGLVIVYRLKDIYEVDTRRKVFHFMMVGMLLPATYVDPAFAALALSAALALFLILDLLRASQLPPLSKPIANFLAPYVDGRDFRGPVVISHIFLLIGCAIPLWLTLASLPRSGEGYLAGWEIPTREVSMVSGVICVGLGDAAASLIGRRWGHRKWVWGGGKSLEGSAAFATAVFIGLISASVWLRVGRWPVTGGKLLSWPAELRNAGVCASVASLTEAVLTGGNDNVIVPVVLWTCVKSLGV